jgi:hypothetical protein
LDARAGRCSGYRGSREKEYIKTFHHGGHRAHREILYQKIFKAPGSMLTVPGFGFMDEGLLR